MDFTVDLAIDPKDETVRITRFIQDVLKKQGFKNVIIAASGGIDSTTSLFLLRKALKPHQILIVRLPYFHEKASSAYFTSHFQTIQKIADKLGIPAKNIIEISIKPMVDEFVKRSYLSSRSDLDKIRLGNIMARVRMIVLYDLAKKHRALVCGTENRSEYHLAYFTRFGDEASDFEPIRHLFKTQVYQLATYLSVPKEIINKSPTAGLWQGQTDEGEFGFTYEEADQVLYLYFDKKRSVKEITGKGFKNAKKIIDWVKVNEYKHNVPYIISR